MAYGAAILCALGGAFEVAVGVDTKRWRHCVRLDEWTFLRGCSIIRCFGEPLSPSPTFLHLRARTSLALTPIHQRQVFKARFRTDYLRR